jgi:hypothetical protein
MILPIMVGMLVVGMTPCVVPVVERYWHPPHEASIVFVGEVIWPRLSLWSVSCLILKSVYKDTHLRILLGLVQVFEPGEHVL